MNWLEGFIAGVRSLFRRTSVELELNEELDLFIEKAAEHNECLGMTPEEARRKARIAVGSRNAVKHRIWSARWESAAENLWKDTRLGMRSLVKSPGFTAVALLSLALGIGANTAIYTLLNAVLLRSLPVPAPHQLVLFGRGLDVGSTGGMPDGSIDLLSYPFYREFAAKHSSYSGVTAVMSVQMRSHLKLPGGNGEEVRIDLVSGSYFSVLGVSPALGRTISEADDKTAGEGAVAVASYGWFQRHFQGNPAAIGRAIRIQGRDYTIIGVAQPGFAGLVPSRGADLWVPLSMEKEISPGWNGLMDVQFRSLYIIGRLKPEVSLAQAATETNLLFRRIIRGEFLSDHPSERDLAQLQKATIELTPASRGLPGTRAKLTVPIAILMGIVALVLLMACANIANMLLARGVARSHEVAIRQSLGASRRRIVLQLLTESSLVAVGGALLGVAMAWGCGRVLAVTISHGSTAQIPEYLAPDMNVLYFALGVTVLTALLFGMFPALRASRLELTSALKDGRGSSQANARAALSRGLVTGQIALSVLLLAAAGLFLRSLMNLNQVDVGFDPTRITQFSLDEYAANLPLDGRLVQLQKQIERSVEALPGVESASFGMFVFNQGMWSDSMVVEGAPRTPENGEDALYNVVGNDYLKTMGIPLIAGRNFTDSDTDKGPHVAIVNETLARRFFPNSSPIGHRFCLCDADPAHGQPGPFDIEIVGVARDSRTVSLGEDQHMVAYFPYAQRVQYFGNLVVRSGLSSEVLAPAVRRAIAQANPEIAVASARPVTEIVEASISTQRTVGVLSAIFAGLAVFLAAIGVYGLISYSVARRTHEIGIRLALGADAGKVTWMVVRESLMLLAAGLAVGLPVALGIARGLSQLLEGQLYKVSTVDPVTFAAAACVVCVMTLCAAWAPARRAARVDPIEALRCE
jgi:predicted permease